MPTPARRTNKYLLYLVTIGSASATGYMKGSHDVSDLFAAVWGLVTFILAGWFLKLNLDDRERIVSTAYEAGFRHGQETRLIHMASGTRPGEGKSGPPE